MTTTAAGDAMADRSLNPTCEDYHSDESDVVVDFAARRTPPANVGTKRSQPSDLGSTADKSPAPEKVVNIDQQSDSGYSSHTAATMSSTNSAQSAKSSRSPPTTVVDTAPMPPPSPAPKRRPTLKDERKTKGSGSSQHSPSKPLQRSGSIASRGDRPPRTRRTPSDECTDPNCTKCGPDASASRGRRPPRPAPLSTDSALDISSDQRSQRSDPAASYASPPSPSYSRQPAPYAHGPALVQAAQTTRRRSSSSTRARPVSYHGDPSQAYYAPMIPNPYPSPPHEHGPPPSMSAHFNMPHPHMSYGMPFLPPGHHLQTSPPYEMQRPPLPTNNSNFNTRRPTSLYGAPLITQELGNAAMPSARYPAAPQSARQERFSRSTFDSDSSEDSYSEDERVADDRALMPPPPLKSKTGSQRRPSIAHRASTTQAYAERRPSISQSQMLPERPRERDPRGSRASTAAPSRASSVSRPALVHPKAQSSYDTPRARITVESNPKSRRRQSYVAYETGYDVEEELARQARRERRQSVAYDEFDVDDRLEKQERRRSKIYRDESEVAPIPRRRRTDADVRRPVERIVQGKLKDTVNDVEAYQQRTRGSEAPYNEQIHKAAKRASRAPSGPSESSSRSKSDRASRISQSNRTTVTNGQGEIRLRVDASAPLSLQFNGDMDGRLVQFAPGVDGMAELIICNPRGEENSYRSERGSVLGRKAVQASEARREAEEESVRSSRTVRSTRDAEGRTLRRRRDTEYFDTSRR